MDRISEAELVGVILHEIDHVVLRHPFLFPEQADPGPDFDLWAAIVAEEITVNEFVTLPLPGSPLRLAEFMAECPALEPLESTRDRYRKLCDPARARRDYAEQRRLKRSLEDQLQALLASLEAAGSARLPDSRR